VNVALVCADVADDVLRIAGALRDSSDRVTILAACASDPGERVENETRVIRFRFDRSDVKRFRAIERRLGEGDASPAQRAAALTEVEVDAFVRNLPNSTRLLSYLARHTDEFDAILFIGGDTGIALRGWRIARERTAVLSRIVDVPQAHLEPFAAMLLGAGAIALGSEAEVELAREIYGPSISVRSTVMESPESLREMLVSISARRGPTLRSGARPIRHYLPSAQYGESTTLLAIQLDTLLRDAGYRSRVVSPDRDFRLGAQVADPSEEELLEALDVGYGDEDAFPRAPRIELGAEALPSFVDVDGRRTPIPPYLNIESWSVEPPRAVFAPLADGKNNLLCVGDIVPDNRILELIELYRYYVMMDFDSRLILAGPKPDEEYGARVREYIARCGLQSRVQLTGTVSQPALAAMYRTARAFVSVRKRFETGLSLLEAMAFDVPVCVLDTPSSRALTGGKTVLFSGLSSAMEVAALWRAVVTNVSLRDRIVASQRSYLASLTPERTLRAVEDALGLANDLVRA
jgi:glycosyltransferase involved in cell wall biosynthesis